VLVLLTTTGGGLDDPVDGLTFAVENFFSVAMMAPLRWAAFRALLPLIVVSRVATPGPRTLLPILVVDSQSSDILLVDVRYCEESVVSSVSWPGW
jgi:hypothetical protein